MVRVFWQKKIEQAWSEKSVVWLTGVRRSGKTTICRTLADEQKYFDCELPRVRRLLEDAEQFFSNHPKGPIALDEIHRLDNASEVLKIAADHFPDIKVLATGSSTLAASKKFQDTLTDRKRVVFLTPMSLEDTKALGNVDLRHRLDRGGLPPFFLAKEFPEKGYQEWTESFWAKDIEELFNVDKKHAFLKFFELLALQSGGLFEAQSFAAPCGVSHTTIATYLQVMAQTHVASILRPFHKNQAKEIIAAAKVYFFDTGFINYFKGQTTSNAQDLGFHWENLVLNQLLTFLNRDEIYYWRDKSKNEVDFVVKRRGEKPLAIECKWSAKEFDAKAITKFREIHPGGKNLVVTQDTLHRREKAMGSEKYLFCPLTSLSDVIKPKLK